MREIRKDPISDRWVAISTERGRRPSDFGITSVSSELGDPKLCPFCEGSEDKTPPEILAWRKQGTQTNRPGWDIRVVPNKFPAFVIEGDASRSGRGIYDMIKGVGAHEVIIESPKHDASIPDMDDEQVCKILWSYKHRIVDLEKDIRFRYVLVFKNHGKAAGSSLPHPHSQLIATPITPRYVKLELANSRAYFQEKERCIFCDIIQYELEVGERIVYENEHFVVMAPFASRFPFELWLLPRRHEFGFQVFPDSNRIMLARCLKNILKRIKVALNDPPYNYVLHTSPSSVPRPGKPDYWGTMQYDFHWHIEIIPRLIKTAGFEWGSGLYINPTAPEEAAKFLREVEI